MLIRSSAYLKKLRKGKRKRHQPRFESLEARQLLAAVIWDAGGDGTSYTDPLNWSGDAIPGPTDDVTIDLDGGGNPYNILVNTDQQVRSLRIESENAQVQLSAGIFTAESITIDAGRFVSTGGDVVATSIVNQDRLAFGRTVDLQVGEIVNHGSLTVSSSSSSDISLDGSLRNHGEFAFNSSGTSAGTLTVDNGTIINESGGVITIGGPGTRTQSIRAGFENSGDLTFRGGFVNFGDGDDFITNSGNVAVDSGTRFATFDSQTSINQQAGTFVVDGDLFLDNGTLSVTGGELTVNDLFLVDNGGLINVSAGNIRNDGVLQLNQRGTFNFTGGDIAGSEPVQIFGSVELNVIGTGSFNAQTRGDTTVSGKLSPNQTLTVIRGNSGLEFTPGFTNEGTIEFSNPEASAQTISTTDGSAFQNLAAGTLRFTRTDRFTAIGTFIQSPIENSGTVVIDTIVSDSKLNELNNRGTFHVTSSGRYTRSSAGSGTVRSFLQTGGTLTNEGSFDGRGLTLEYSGGNALGTFTPRDLVLVNGSGGSGVFSPTNSFAGDIQFGQTVLIDSPNVDINSDVRNAGTIRFIPPADGSQASLFVNDSVFSNLAGGEIDLEAVVGQSAFVFGSIINDGVIRVSRGAARIDGVLNRDRVIVEEDGTLFQRVNTAFIQEDGSLQLAGTGLFKGLFDYRGGSISGVVHISDGGSLAVAENLPASEYLLTQGGSFASNLPSSATVTISNVGSSTNVDSYDAVTDFAVDGVLMIGDAASTGLRIDLEVPGTLSIGSTGSIRTRGIESRLETTLNNEGTFDVEALTTVTRADAIHVNGGELRIFDETLRLFGDGLINEESGSVGGTGSLFLDDGTFGFSPTTFSNAGTLAAGQSPGLLTITATNSLLTATGKVIAEIDGANPASDFDVLSFVGDVSLDGQLDVVTANEFTPNTGTTFEILTASAITGAFADTTLSGNPAAFYSVNGDSDSVTLTSVIAETDLAARFDAVPTVATSTKPISVSYTVTNQGLPTEIERWTDRLYLSPTETFDLATAKLVAEIPHQGGLATGESYSETVNIRLPATLPGNYRLLLLSDSKLQASDADRENNRVASPPLAVSVDTITFDALEQRTVRSGTESLLQLIVPAGTDFSIATNSDISGSHEISILKNAVPSPRRFDLRSFQSGSSSNSITTSSDELSNFFLLISGRENATDPVDVSVLAETLPLTVKAATPDVVGNDGPFTLSIEGAGFKATSTVELITPDGAPIESSEVQVDSSNRLIAVFDLNNEQLGEFDLRIADESGSDTLFDAVTVSETNAGRAVSVLNAPAVIRNLREATLTVETTNVGNTDAPAALRTLLIPNSNVRLSESAEFSPDIIEFFVSDPGNPDGSLAPHTQIRTEIRFQQLISSSVVPISLQTPDNSLELDHFAVTDDLRPESISVDDWSEIYEQYVEFVGTNYGEYQDALGSAAADLAKLGIRTAEVAKLRAYLFVVAGADQALASQLEVGTADPSIVSDALTRFARPLSLSSVVRREGGDSVSDLQTAAFTFSIERATSRIVNALNEQLGEAFSAALSTAERAELETAIELFLSSGGFTQLDDNFAELASSIANDDLRTLEAFRNLQVGARLEIQQVMDALRATASDSIESLGLLERDQLKRGINQLIREGQTVGDLIESVNESSAENIIVFRTKAAELDAARLLSLLSDDFLATQTSESLARLEAGVVSELLRGVDFDVFANRFGSGSVSLIDLLVADETQEERQIDAFIEELQFSGLDAFLGNLTPRQLTELREIVRQAVRERPENEVSAPERFANAMLAELGEGTRAALEAAKRQLEVNQILKQVVQEDPTGNFAALDRAQLELVADRIDESIRDEPSVDVVKGDARKRVKDAIIAEAPDASNFIRELEVDNLLDEAFKDFDLGFLERELIEARLREDLDIDLDELVKDPNAGADLVRGLVILPAERIVNAGQADDINEAVKRLGNENQANKLLAEFINGNNQADAIVDNLDALQREELVKLVADQLENVGEARRGELIPLINGLIQGNGGEGLGERLDDSRKERDQNAVLNLLKQDNEFKQVLDLLDERERDGLRLLIQEAAPDAELLRDFAQILAENFGGIGNALAIKKELADFKNRNDVDEFFDALEQDPELDDVFDGLEDAQKDEFKRQLVEIVENGGKLDLDNFRDELLDGDIEIFAEQLDRAKDVAQAELRLNDLADDPEVGRAIQGISVAQNDAVVRLLIDDPNALEILQEIGRLPLEQRDAALDRLIAEQAAKDLLAQNDGLAPLVDLLDPVELREFQRLIADDLQEGFLDPDDPDGIRIPGSVQGLKPFLRDKAKEREAERLLNDAAANKEVDRTIELLSADAIGELIQSLVDRLAGGITAQDVKEEIQSQGPAELNRSLERQAKNRAVLEYRAALEAIPAVGALLNTVSDLSSRVDADIAVAIEAGLPFFDFGGFVVDAGDDLRDRLVAEAPDRNSDQFIQEVAAAGAQAIIDSLTAAQAGELTAQAGERNLLAQSFDASGFIDAALLAPTAVAGQLVAQGTASAQAALESAATKRNDDAFLNRALDLEGGARLQTQLSQLSERARTELSVTIREIRETGGTEELLQQFLVAGATADGGLNATLEQDSFRRDTGRTIDLVLENEEAAAAFATLTAAQQIELRNQLDQFFESVALIQDNGLEEFSPDSVAANQIDALRNDVAGVQSSLQNRLNEQTDEQTLQQVLDFEGGAELQDQIDRLSDRAKEELNATIRDANEAALSISVIRLILIDGASSEGGLNGNLESDSFARNASQTLEIILQDPEAQAALQDLTPDQLDAYRDQLEQFFENIAISQDLGLGEFDPSDVAANQIDVIKNDLELLRESLQDDIDQAADEQFLADALDFEGGNELRAEISQLSDRATSELNLTIREEREESGSSDQLRQILLASGLSGSSLESDLRNLSVTRQRIATLDLMLSDPEAGPAFLALTPNQQLEYSNQLDRFFESVADAQDRGLVVFAPETLANEQIDQLNNDFDNLQQSLQESIDLSADQQKLEEALDFEGGEAIRNEIAQLSDRARAELNATIRQTTDANRLRQILIAKSSSEEGLNKSLEEDTFFLQAGKTLDLILQDPVAASFTIEQITELRDQLQDFFESVAPAQDRGLVEFSPESVAADQLQAYREDLAKTLQDLDASIAQAEASEFARELNNAGRINLDGLGVGQLDTLTRMITELFDSESGQSPNDFFDAVFGNELPEDVLEVFGTQFAISDFIGRLEADPEFQAQFSFSEFLAGLSSESRDGFELAIELALLGPEGNSTDARAAVERILQSDDPVSQLNNLDANEAIVDARLETLKEEATDELSVDAERAVANALRARLRNSDVSVVDAEIADIGADAFIQKAEQEQQKATTKLAIEKYEQFLSENDLNPSDEERRLAENSIEGLVALGKSAKEIDEAIRRNAGASPASDAVRASSENKEKAKELVAQIEVVRAGQAAFQNEQPLSDSEREALCNAIAARLASGEPAGKILGELQTLSSRKFQSLIGRETDASGQKQKETETHQRNAAATDKKKSDSAGAQDPNDIVGPEGFGPQRFIAGQRRLDYTIRFENIETATAAAQEVFITHPIDSDFDLSTFELTAFGFGDLVIDIPEGRDRFETLIDLEESLGLFVEFDASIDLTSGIARWTFRAVDPETGDLVSDPFAGFLPPNVIPGEGEGFVSYSIVPQVDLETTTRLDAQATIVFDLEAPIDTPPIFNTIDADEPSSELAALPPVLDSASIPLSWSGTDGQGSGIAHYDVLVSENGGPFQLFADNLADTSIQFLGQDNHRYDFLVIATDNVGRIENKALNSEAFTRLDINDLPVAQEDQASTLEDTTVDVSVLSNDFDIDGDALDVSVLDSPAHGLATVLPDGQIRYVPSPNFNGQDFFTYQIDDGRGGRSTGTVQIAVDAVNDAPIATNDTVEAIEDEAIVFDVRQNDRDAENDRLSVKIETQPSRGSLVQNFDGTITYRPSQDFNGTDEFTYSLSDGRQDSEHAVVTIVVAPENDAPLSESEQVSSSEDSVITVNVLANDLDIDGDSLNVELLRQPSNGAAAVDSDGNIVYTPEPDFFGDEIVVYRAIDSSGAFSIATLEIVVSNVNDAPRIDTPLTNRTVGEDASPQVIDLTGVFEDIDSTDLSFDVSSSNGDLVTANLVGTELTLTPVADQNGEATITLTATDGELSVSSTFLFSVTPINDAPFVAAEIGDQTVDEDSGSTVIDLSGVFSDVDSDELEFSVVSDDDNLISVAIQGTQLIVSTVADANGTTLVSVTASDGELEASETFSITVSPINDAPTVAQPIPNQSVDEDAPPMVIDLTGVFADIDSSELGLRAFTSDANLVTAEIVGTELLLSLTPDANGEATITLTASDGDLSVDSSFLLSIAPINDAPFVVTELPNLSVNEDEGTTFIDLSAVFADIDSDPLSLTAISDDEGLISASIVDTQLAITTVADANGTARVTVIASDGELEVSDSFVVNVVPVNDAPAVAIPTADVNVVQDSEQQVIVLTGTFVDVDSDALSLSVVSDDESLVTPSLDGETLTLSFQPGATGTTTVTVTADDGEFSVNDTFVVIVSPIDNSPVRLVDGVLNILGDRDDRSDRDKIRIRRLGEALIVQVNWGRASAEFFEFDASLVERVNVHAGDGNDLVHVQPQINLPIDVDGGHGNDLIRTARGNDTIVDLQGRNFIFSGDGDDFVSTGPGNDTIHSDDGDDRIVDTGGANWISSGRGRDWIQTGDGSDTIFAGHGNDFVSAGGGRNRVWGGDGSDVLLAGAGRDLLVGGGGNDAISSGDGDDRVYGGSGSDLIIAGRGRDRVDGGSGRDVVVSESTENDSDVEALDQALQSWLHYDVESALLHLGEILDDDENDHVFNAWWVC